MAKSFSMESLNAAQRKAVQTLQGPVPVSYTHLDVYKRQLLSSSSAKGMIFVSFNELSSQDTKFIKRKTI